MVLRDHSNHHEQQAEMDDPSRQAEFLRRLASVYAEVHAAALVIVGNRSDADDVFQEVCVVLWQKYDQFEPGTNFQKWACTVSFNVAENFVRKQRRHSIGLSDYAMAQIEQVHTGGTELYELRQELLVECVAKLNERDRKFLEECYSTTRTMTELARSRKMPIETIYTRLKRLRKKISDCIERTLGKGY